MEAANILEKHREAAREEWQDAERAGAWARWHTKFAIQSRAATEAIVRECGAAAGDRVLDLASGSGEPALELARTVGANGRVVATDLSHPMAKSVLQKARAE